MRRFKDITGTRFGRLVVVGVAPSVNGCRMWKCECLCGKETVKRGPDLSFGHTNSCGCLAVELTIKRSTTHGMTLTPEYMAWRAMHGRCYNPSVESYKRYGARGITVCERWKKFEAFFEDMGPRSNENPSGRKDNNGNYEPTNCEWADKFAQANNRSDNHPVSIEGKSLTITQWARISGLKWDTIAWRIRKGWDAKMAVFKPARNMTLR